MDTNRNMGIRLRHSWGVMGQGVVICWVGKEGYGYGDIIILNR